MISQFIRNTKARSFSSTKNRYNIGALKLINKYAEDGDLQNAERVVGLALQESPLKETMIYNTVIKAAANSGNLRAAEKWYNKMVKKNVRLNDKTFGKIIEAAAKVGQLEEAQKWFQIMKDENKADSMLVKYNILLDACAKAHNPEAAKKYLSEMLDQGITPSIISYNTVIGAFAKSGDVDGARSWFKYMSEKVQPNQSSYHALLDAAAKGRCREAVAEILAEMRTQDIEITVETYNRVIAVYANLGDCDAANRVFDEMEEAGIKPDLNSYNSLIYSHTAVEESTRSGALDVASVLSRMQERSIKPDIITYTTIMDVYAQNGLVSGAATYLEKIKEDGMSPDSTCYATILKACAKSKRWKTAVQWFDVAEKDLGANFLNAACYAQMIRCAQSCRLLKDSVNYLYKADEVNIRLSAATYTDVISTLSKGKMSKKAQHVLSVMKKVHKPDLIAYTAVLSGFCNQLEANNANKLWKEMRAMNVQPDVYSYTIMMKLHSKLNDYKTAAEYFEAMIRDGMEPSPWAFHALMGGKTANAPDRTEKVFRRCMQMNIKPNNDMIHTLRKTVEPATFNQLNQEFGLDQIFESNKVEIKLLKLKPKPATNKLARPSSTNPDSK